jgi:hypothetical protein
MAIAKSAFVGIATRHPAIQEQPLLADLDQVHGACDGLGGTQKGNARFSNSSFCDRTHHTSILGNQGKGAEACGPPVCGGDSCAEDVL